MTLKRCFFFKVLSGFLTCILNLYLLLAILVEKKLRSLAFFPIALQAFCDILVGQSVSRHSLADVTDGYVTKSEDGSWIFRNPYAGTIEHTVHKMIFPSETVFGKSLSNFLNNEFNLFSTPYCILVIAVERYVMVCWPFRSKKLLTTRNRFFIGVFLTLFVPIYSFLMFACENIYYLADQNYYDYFYRVCYKSLFRKNLAHLIVFFIFPAFLTLILYSMVGIRLAKSRANQSRNRDLTVAFLISCALWIILWTPKTTEDILYWYNPSLVLYYTDSFKLASFILNHFSHACFVLYSLINPMVLIFVTRNFQKPFKQFCCKRWNQPAE